MSRIEINAGGRSIVIDHDGELEPLRQAALSLWQQTDGPDRTEPAIGFRDERRWTPPVAPTQIGQYGRPPFEPVTAGQPEGSHRG